jgi:DNA repair ATPase RecN
VLSKYVASVEELNEVCEEILNNLAELEDVDEFLEEVEANSAGELVAKLLVAAFALQGGGKVDPEDVARVAEEVEANIRMTPHRVPMCVELARVVGYVGEEE